MRTTKTYLITNLDLDFDSENAIEMTDFEFSRMLTNPPKNLKGLQWVALLVIITYPNGLQKQGIIEKAYLD